MIALVAAVCVVVIQWVARQWLGNNVWIGWLESAALLGFFGAALAIPDVLKDGHRQAAILLAAFALAANSCAYLLLAETHLGRFFFLPEFTLTLPAVVTLFAATLLIIRGIGSSRRQTTTHNVPVDRTVVTSAFVIVITTVLALAFSPADQPGYLLLGQVVWSVLGQDDFLALLIVGCTIECARPAGATSGLLGEATVDGQHEGISGPGLELAGLSMPFGRLAMATAIFLGIRGADAMATLVVPAAAIVLVAATLERPRFTLGAVIALGLVAATSLTLLGYARPVEAFAVVCAVFAGVILLSGKRRVIRNKFPEILARHIGALALYVFAGAFLFLVSGVIGFQGTIAKAVEATGLGLIPAGTAVMVIAILLCRRLSPLEILLVSLPVAPVALQAAGASLLQSFAIVCISIALAPAACRFVTSEGCEDDRPTYILLCVALSVLFAIMAFPIVVEALPVRSRFW